MGDATTIAAAACKRLAARWGRRRDWREFWGVAWAAVSRAAARGVPDRHLATAAVRGVIDSLRAERPDPAVRRAGARPVPPHQSGDEPRTADGVTLFDGLASPKRPDPPERRLAELWADTRRHRGPLTPRARLWLYLWLVEGWTQAEVAAAWGVTGAAVAHHLAYAARNLGRAGEFASACLAVRSARCGDTMRAAP